MDSNNDWRDHVNASAIPGILKPTNDREAVIMRTLSPGAYTAIVSGINNESGIGIVEVIEIEDTGLTRLANIATRGFVGADDQVLIAGIIISGTDNKTVLIRAKGPSLAELGVSGVLSDPQITLYSGASIIDDNDDWQSYARADDIPTELQPSQKLEAVIYTELSPGAYTAIVSGVDGATGVGIVEVFEVQ